MPLATNRFYVEPSAGNDANDGRDLLGLTLVNATYDHTGNGEGERHLSSVGDFAGYTFASGDKIYLLNAAGGVVTGLYSIASKVDADAILLTADAGLTADSTNDVDSSDGPWATMQKGADTCVAGQDCYFDNGSTETTAAQVDFDTNSGTVGGGPIQFIACDSAGDSLTSGHYILQASAEIGNLILFAGSISNIFFRRIDLDGNGNVGSDGVGMAGGSTNGSGSKFMSCKIHHVSGDGADIRAGGGVSFIDCDVYSNGGVGIKAANTASSRWAQGAIMGCRIHDNFSHGIGNLTTQGKMIVDNEIYDNGGSGIETAASNGNEAGQFVLRGNTVYGNALHGIELENVVGILFSAQVNAVYNNTSSGNGGYGFFFNNVTPQDIPFMDFNHTHNNTSGATDRTAGMFGDNNQTDDPQFASVVDGSEDFIPANGSPLTENGLMGVDIGARKAADPVGGGSNGVSVGRLFGGT